MDNNTPLRRIHITGAAGGGKTTLAKYLAACLSTPWHELDMVAFVKGARSKRTLEERLADVREIVAQPKWITEGAYLWWAIDLFKAADCIIWLDLPWHIAIKRIITRHTKASLAGTNRHPGIIKLSRFVWGYRKYYMDKIPDSPVGLDDDRAGNYAATVLFMTAYADKLIRCQSPSDVRAVMRSIAEKNIDSEIPRRNPEWLR